MSMPDDAGLPLTTAEELAVRRIVVEVEQHVARDGWDAPFRIFALVRTAGALERDTDLAGQLPPEVVAAAQEDPASLMAVPQPQDKLPEADDL